MNIRKPILAALTYAALALTASSANALVIYDWTGTRTSGGSGNPTTVTAVLTLDDSYIPGSALSFSHFVSFDYFDSSCAGTCYFPNSFHPATDLTGTLPVMWGTSIADVFLETTDSARTSFRSDASGAWQLLYDPASGQNHQGNNGVWHLRVPEPATLALFGLGLAGLGVARRRKAAS